MHVVRRSAPSCQRATKGAISSRKTPSSSPHICSSASASFELRMARIAAASFSRTSCLSFSGPEAVGSAGPTVGVAGRGGGGLRVGVRGADATRGGSIVGREPSRGSDTGRGSSTVILGAVRGGVAGARGTGETACGGEPPAGSTRVFRPGGFFRTCGGLSSSPLLELSAKVASAEPFLGRPERGLFDFVAEVLSI